LIANLPGGMPLANVIGKGGIAINEATAKAPPAVATGAAKRLKTSGTFKQECVLQGLLSFPNPEQFPPFCSISIFLRDLVLVPTPQSLEQDDQVDQGPQTQSSEQECVLQGLLSLPDPEQFPPFCSISIFLRDLVLVPTPQSFEQDDQVDQGPQTQSSG
jgi:hypothetical protein